MIKKEFIIKNELGLHARAAALFVKTTNKFVSEIYIEKNNEKVNAKSIMCIMALGISKDCKITIIVDGPDENEAITELTKLINEELMSL